MCTIRDTSKERYPGEYYGQREVDEATAVLKAKRGSIEAVRAGENEGLEIPYPLCSECGKRHPPLDYLQETGQGICEICGRVDRLPRGVAPDSTENVENEWTHADGTSKFVDYLPLHKNERGQWCKRPVRVLRNASIH